MNKGRDEEVVIKRKNRQKKKNLLINETADHGGAVVVREETDTYPMEHPEGLFLGDKEKKHSPKDIHGLTIANRRMVKSKDLKDPSQRGDGLGCLVERQLRQGPLQIPLDLADKKRIETTAEIRRRKIKSKTLFSFVPLVHRSSCTDHPHPAPQVSRNTLPDEAQ